ncbi:MAG: hypothetical protein CVV42_00465 [Candidatus Riflebacteria bacterium HGW-Riflebacteria-2]|jgi:hypothetical protein|nr:MAG: hypothetical protein CVV42_00465 [Candidatus Riflebacteria bacterium HGW-Riflebacteria-2]
MVCLFFLLAVNGYAADSLLGNWVYQSPHGDISLQFTSANQLVFDGDPASYQVQGNNLIVTADEEETMSYPYSLQNDQLQITFPDGSQLMFTRAGATAGDANMPGMVPAGGNPTGVVPAAGGGQVFQELVGRWKDIRSSGHTIIELHANGQFSYYSDTTAGNSNYGETNWGYGSSSGTRGSWQARGTAQQGVIYYQTESGEQDTLDYRIQMEKGQVFWNECYFDGKLYQKQ